MNPIQMVNIDRLVSWKCIFEYVKYYPVSEYETKCEDFYRSAMRLNVVNDGDFL